jgi:hypothetical protein
MLKRANIMARCPKLQPQNRKRYVVESSTFEFKMQQIQRNIKLQSFSPLENCRIPNASPLLSVLPMFLRSIHSSLLRSAGLEEVTLSRECGGPVVLQVATSVFDADWSAQTVTVFNGIDGGVRVNHKSEAICRILVGEVR